MQLIYGLLLGLVIGFIAGALFFRKNQATITADVAKAKNVASQL